MSTDPFYSHWLSMKPLEIVGMISASAAGMRWAWKRFYIPVKEWFAKRNALMNDLREVAAEFRNGFWVRIKAIEDSAAVHDQQLWCYFAAVGSVDLGVFTADADGLITRSSPAYTRWTGRSSEELMGYGWQDAVHPECLREMSDKWAAAVRSHRRFEETVGFRTPDGRRIDIVTDAVPILIDHKLIGYFGVGRRKIKGD